MRLFDVTFKISFGRKHFATLLTLERLLALLRSRMCACVVSIQSVQIRMKRVTHLTHDVTSNVLKQI